MAHIQKSCTEGGKPVKKEKVADGDLNPIKTNPAILKALYLQVPVIS